MSQSESCLNMHVQGTFELGNGCDFAMEKNPSDRVHCIEDIGVENGPNI